MRSLALAKVTHPYKVMLTLHFWKIRGYTCNSLTGCMHRKPFVCGNEDLLEKAWSRWKINYFLVLGFFSSIEYLKKVDREKDHK